jgi:hypothetical protein
LDIDEISLVELWTNFSSQVFSSFRSDRESIRISWSRELMETG